MYNMKIVFFPVVNLFAFKMIFEVEGYIGKSLLLFIHIPDSTANGVKTNYGSSALKLTKQKVN